jgi:hypothetical protein
MWPTAILTYCSTHLNDPKCNSSSSPAEIIAIAVVAVIVALVVFDIVWKFSRRSRGPLMRLLAAIVSRLTGDGARRR